MPDDTPTKEAVRLANIADEAWADAESIDDIARALDEAGLREAVEALGEVAHTCGEEADETYWVGHGTSLRVHAALRRLQGDSDE